MKKLIGMFVVFICAVCVAAEPWPFSWDASPGVEVDGYYLYASTNAFGPDVPTSYVAKVDCGNATTVTIDRLRTGTLYFTVTAYADSVNTVNGTNYTVRIESVPSNSVILKVPEPPNNMATLAVQWVGTLASTNWTDMGFFRLKLGL